MDILAEIERRRDIQNQRTPHHDSCGITKRTRTKAKECATPEGKPLGVSVGGVFTGGQPT